MKKLLVILLLLAVPTNVFAAVAFDARSNSTNTNTDPQTFTHTPVGTPKAIIVYVHSRENGGGGDQVNGVTYGGVAMTEVTNSPLNSTSTAYAMSAWFLGSSIPTGAQTVSVDYSGSSQNRVSSAISLTASADTEIVTTNAQIAGSTLTNPSVVVALSGRTSFVSEGFFSGQNAVGSVTPPSGWTSGFETDMGVEVSGDYYYNTVASSDVTAGWTQGADAAYAIVTVISEVSAPPSGEATSTPKSFIQGGATSIVGGAITIK